MDKKTRDWADGVLSKTFKLANEDLPVRGPTEKGPREELRYILFDGDVDAVWVEDMNSVMDDNKLLTLSNGDRIRLKHYTKLLFEVFDLQFASPATISRCGMVYVDPEELKYEPYFRMWMNKKIKPYAER
jgi:dynein heavy chain, axonemal